MKPPQHYAGQAAARAGLPHTDNPHPKPEAPATGDLYPGDWANWLGGWITARSSAKQDCVEACKDLCEFMAPAIR